MAMISEIVASSLVNLAIFQGQAVTARDNTRIFPFVAILFSFLKSILFL